MGCLGAGAICLGQGTGLSEDSAVRECASVAGLREQGKWSLSGRWHVSSGKGHGWLGGMSPGLTKQDKFYRGSLIAQNVCGLCRSLGALGSRACMIGAFAVFNSNGILRFGVIWAVSGGLWHPRNVPCGDGREDGGGRLGWADCPLSLQALGLCSYVTIYDKGGKDLASGDPGRRIWPRGPPSGGPRNLRSSGMPLY